ncbi:MAG: hypothetical protein KF878_24780 [Planctomycetes bacterium]|nr:hypothetical protein [Planctomycetota bacterium]
MALVYCEICGVLIKGPQGHAPVPEGVICDECFASRRAVVTDEAPAAPESGAMVQFNCCYCRSLLRLRAVAKRSRIKCPKCNDSFYLHPDGRIESRLEGNTTAIISTEQALRPLTPAEGLTPPQGSPAKTQPLHRDLLNKTQPIAREPLPSPPSKQQALLDELKPKKLDFLAGVPDRPRGEAMVDTDAYESSRLDLLPDGVGPGQVQPGLRPSEEGRVDLDAEGLRRKTAKYQQKHATKKRQQVEEPEPEPTPARKTGKRQKAGDDKAADKNAADKDARHEERERRAAEAARKAQELQAREAKRSLGALSLTLVTVLPAVVALLLLSMTTRGSGFAVRGAFGEQMKAAGAKVDRGVRSLGTMLNPHLPPEVRLPETGGPR